MSNRPLVNVDVDWMDPEYIKSMPIVPHDQTSNQLWVDIQLGHSSNQELFRQVATELKNEGWLAIYTRMVCPRAPHPDDSPSTDALPRA